ncbi:hypothetical protein M5W83_06585 [Paenibacillus thiaminolyticus]|uniref:DUF2933 domain-containing protein n=1 Tax=Paenibacillus thiaminolyticus TaxID=49283 RepID=A0AAP9DRD3_PANTH|nr:hypothetical protein [Paenibacillus thiaminolyticus]MCY9534952.1 hypothetical protein [Paenibacillus thiaminolyticus]MCY9603917.1 hypothetical protein [Paenibacillus thiaminolyticus]MCY9606821.1 hypothetical protein [Paenibacillus thiaminolyticus]MCY9615813.1 hypothetical protein [Paenibacillus thiaminolyticus]MCY9619047.1 hypothetical protein [Paenibacillus thiaminolyticus]
MDWTWLLLLACPIMMVLMMFGMMRGGHGHGHGDHGKGTSEDMQKMQRELDEVKAQNERMRKDIQNLTR